MGGIEVLFWIAIIVFSLLRGVQKNKQRPPVKQSPSNGTGQPTLDPLQEAIREIESVLRGETPPSQQPRQPDPLQEKTDPTREVKSKRPSYEPEFHSMEASIPSRELESKTTFTESYSQKMLEKKTTYEDSFRKSEYYDDTFKHAHPESSDSAQRQKSQRVKKEHPLKSRLKSKKGLAEAIVLQTILTRRSFPPRRD